MLPLKILTPYLVVHCIDLGTALMLSSVISSSETFAYRLLAGAVYIVSYKEPHDHSDCCKLFVWDTVCVGKTMTCDLCFVSAAYEH